MFLDRLDINQQANGQMVYNGAGRIIDSLQLNAFYDIELVRGGVVIARQRFKNGITNDGKNNLLNRFFNGTGTSATAWSIGLIDNAGFSAIAPTDTMAVHSGWVEFVGYLRVSDNSNLFRGSWTKGTATGQQITNSAAVGYTITANGNIYGIFGVSDSGKAGTTGTLWNTAAFNAVLAVAIDDVLNVTYTLQL